MSKQIKASDLYPITTIAYPNGHKSVVILREHLRQYTPPIKYPILMEYLTGQTTTPDGVYVGDVEDWLNSKPVTD